jgi:hypothetical protein
LLDGIRKIEFPISTNYELQMYMKRLTKLLQSMFENNLKKKTLHKIINHIGTFIILGKLVK